MIPVAARRAFRLTGVTASSLVAAYAMDLPLPYLAPVFAIVLTTSPAPPPGLKGLVTLLLVVTVTVGSGLVMIPLLLNYPVTAVLVIAAGIYLGAVISLEMRKAAVGLLLTIGLTMVPAAGMVDYALAEGLVESLLISIAIVVVCQWLVYPLFPEAPGSAAPPVPTPMAEARWIALRSALIVLPPVMLAFSNPALYLATILKSLLLGQQGSDVTARAAGRELLGSTFLAGCFAILFWFALQSSPTLWMFFLWTLVFGGYCAAKMYGALGSRFTPSFWQNVIVTLLILLGPAVQDSATGKDVYQAFAVRLSLFVAVSIYAWLAVVALEGWRSRTAPSSISPAPVAG